ncbi:DUF4097 family beta strand repeat-containing protein [Streptomyces tsukubensis]|uniref:DUF4097 family beta strand repeat-containing protein n=1 Tax=Streptomyces tsukubensis TaxID=83656 RepID=UPI00344F036C
MRRRRLRLIALVAVAGVVTTGVSGCGMTRGDSFDDNTTLSGKINSVLLDGSGDVTVRGRKGGAPLTLERRVDYKGDRPKKPTYRVENGVLVLGGCGKDCTAEYEVEVPDGTPVRGKVSGGTVKLSQVGAVRVTTGSGRIEMNGVTGAVEVVTGKGRITGRNLKGGPVRAQASDGTVHLTARTPVSATVRTDGGRINLRVPKGRYKVSVASEGGDTDVDMAHDPAARHGITLRSKDGDILLQDS